MESDLKLGSLGDVVLSFSAGKASLTAKAAVDGSAVSVQASVVCDAGFLIDQLEAIVAKAVPASAPFDPAIFAVIKSAVVAIA